MFEGDQNRSYCISTVFATKMEYSDKWYFIFSRHILSDQYDKIIKIVVMLSEIVKTTARKRNVILIVAHLNVWGKNNLN